MGPGDGRFLRGLEEGSRMVDLELRERRKGLARRRFRQRISIAVALAVLAHLLALPLFLQVFQFEARESAEAPPVEMVRIPAADWDAALAEAERRLGEALPSPSKPRKSTPKREEQKEEPEEAPGQVVDIAPGNDEVDPDARFAAASSNRVEQESIARNRRAGEAVTMPQRTTRELPPEEPPERPSRDPEGEALALGDPGEAPSEEAPGGRNRVEIPSQARRDGLALPENRPGDGRIPHQAGSDELVGNADRFRLELGEGDAEGEGTGEALAGGGELRLFPSGAVVDQIGGGPAPDHGEGGEEGERTFLNTREWKYATFFNRVKGSVARTWDPIAVLRVRDPTGNVYAWKDRVTQLSVVLRLDGSIADIWVERSSGVDFLDREAIAAFERAQPFPHPPRALADERGLIQFSFGFYLQTQEPFRIFRRF